MSIFKIPLSIAVSAMFRGDTKFNKTHKTYGNFNIKKDLNYLGVEEDDDSHKLDIYTNPEKRNGITLFYIHGGGYVYGNKETHKIFISWFTNQGFDVVSINYRLGQKDGTISIEEQVEDAFNALKFIEENKNHYGIKTDNLFLVGDSAGGHIALLLEILMNNKELQEHYQIRDLPNVKIKGVALNSTMYDFSLVVSQSRKMLTKRGCRWMLSKRYLDPEFVRINNPRYYYQNGYKTPNLFASTSYHDYFNSQTLRLERDSKEFNIPIDYLFESSTNKEIGHVYNHFCFENEEGKRCNNAMLEFFNKYSKVAK